MAKVQHRIQKSLGPKAHPFSRITLKDVGPFIKSLLDSNVLTDEFGSFLEDTESDWYDEYDFTNDDSFSGFRNLFPAINNMKPSKFVAYITKPLGVIKERSIDFGSQANRRNFYVIQRYYFALNGSATINCNDQTYTISNKSYLQLPYLLSNVKEDGEVDLKNNKVPYNFRPYVRLSDNIRRKLEMNTNILCLCGMFVVPSSIAQKAIGTKIDMSQMSDRMDEFYEENDDLEEKNKEIKKQHLTADEKRKKVVDTIKQASLKDEFYEGISDEERRDIIRKRLNYYKCV